MNFKCLIGPCLTCFLVLLTFVVTVDCETQGVCNRTRLFTAKVWEPYTRRKIESYFTFAGRCYPGGCRRTRWRVVSDHRLVTKNKIQTDLYCCLGYIEQDRNASHVNCQPVCTPACKNGYCRAPGECGCNPGFDIDPSNNRSCLPFCPEGTCDHGACVAPYTCQCNFGYTKVNFTCLPICTDPCLNGSCIAPETCECDFGFRKSNNNICEPYCSTGCENGTCVGPETCRCNLGYRKVDNDDSYTNQSCAPYCTDPCVNAACVAPDTCQCLPGYVQLENNTCQPRCENGCDNGTCVAPDMCRCNPGWSPKTASECAPVCNDPCGNGTCVAPDTCECFPGHKWNLTCVPECTNGCDGGDCISPDVCQCEKGWEYQNGTCVPKCQYSCGNGTCVSPDVCSCFKGYRLDMIKLLRGISGGLCMPSCANCSGSCVAPNICITDAVTTENDFHGDYDFGDGSTIDDGFVNGSTDPANGSDVSIFYKQTSDEPRAFEAFWLEHRWKIISVPVLFIVIVAVVALVVCRWRYLRHYFKGDSYMVQGNITDAQRTSSFVDVSFAALEKKDKMNC